MKVIFLTDRNGVHVERFSELFNSNFATYQHVEIKLIESVPTIKYQGIEIKGWENITKELDESSDVIITAPLDTVTSNIISKRCAHIGISFATDIMISAAQYHSCQIKLSRILATIDAIIVDNYATENALIGLGIDRCRILRIPWGTTKICKKGENNWQRSESNKNRIIFFPRRVDPHYDPMTFIQSFKEIVDSNLNISAWMINYGESVGLIKDKIIELKISSKVKWLPMMEESKFNEMMNKSNMIVLSPVTDGTSVTLLIAMEMGIPVISSLNNGSAEWIVDGITGWTYSNGDREGLTKAIQDVLDNQSKRKRIIKNAKRLVKCKANWEQNKNKIVEKINQICKTGG